MTKAEAKDLLRAHKLRATAPRMALLTLLDDQPRPVSHSEVVAAFGDSDWDPATLYRNLVKLTDVGLARVVSRAGGMARYELIDGDTAVDHSHPHFACTDCGTVTCLPEDTVASVAVAAPRGRWESAVSKATVQLQGSCPDCLDPASPRS